MKGQSIVDLLTPVTASYHHWLAQNFGWKRPTPPLVLWLVHRWQHGRALTPVVFAVPMALLFESMIGILATSGEKHRVLSFSCSLQPT